jgi:electron transport complex protein RnfC
MSSAPSIVLLPDGQEQSHRPLPTYGRETEDPRALQDLIRRAGIVGLGGAAFPSALKLGSGSNSRLRVLIINGAESEPYVSCDDVLMREQPDKVIRGALAVATALDVGQCLMAVPENNVKALQAVTQALSGLSCTRIQLRIVPSLYPIGAERLLIHALTGQEIPRTANPADFGMVCYNVATCAAIDDALSLSKPLISRYVTVTGRGVAKPATLEVLIGTPVGALVQACGGYTEQASRLIIGGPMMGFAAPDDSLPVVKGCSCVLVGSATELNVPRHEFPCIRCGDCAAVCPVNLLPQQLYWHARSGELQTAQDFGLFDCIECGCCAAVCPSGIPLVQCYRKAKNEVWAETRQREQAEHARMRYQNRKLRLERERNVRDQRLQDKRETLRAGGEDKKEMVQAALRRAAAKRRARESTRSTARKNTTD